MLKSVLLPFTLAIAGLTASPCAAQDAPESGQPDYPASLRCAVLLTVAITSRESGAPPDREAGAALNRYMGHAQRLSGKSGEQVVDDMADVARALLAEISATANPAASRDAAIAACRTNADSLPPVGPASR